MNKHMSDAHWLQSPEVVGRIKPRAKLNKVKQALNTKARKAWEKSAGKSKLCLGSQGSQGRQGGRTLQQKGLEDVRLWQQRLGPRTPISKAQHEHRNEGISGDLEHHSGDTLQTTSCQRAVYSFPALKPWLVSVTKCGVHKKTFLHRGNDQKIIKAQMCNVVPHNFTAILVLNMQHVHFGRHFVLFCFYWNRVPLCWPGKCWTHRSPPASAFLGIELKAWATTSG